MPGLVGPFEVFGVFGGGCLELVVELLDGFSSGVAKLKVLAGVAEGEGGVFFSEFFGFAGLHDETPRNLVTDEVFCLGFGFGGDAPAFQIDFFFGFVCNENIFIPRVGTCGIGDEGDDANFWRFVVFDFKGEGFDRVGNAVGCREGDRIFPFLFVDMGCVFLVALPFVSEVPGDFCFISVEVDDCGGERNRNSREAFFGDTQFFGLSLIHI